VWSRAHLLIVSSISANNQRAAGASEMMSVKAKSGLATTTASARNISISPMGSDCGPTRSHSREHLPQEDEGDDAVNDCRLGLNVNDNGAPEGTTLELAVKNTAPEIQKVARKNSFSMYWTMYRLSRRTCWVLYQTRSQMLNKLCQKVPAKKVSR
jgi:hypothetical protein